MGAGDWSPTTTRPMCRIHRVISLRPAERLAEMAHLKTPPPSGQGNVAGVQCGTQNPPGLRLKRSVADCAAEGQEVPPTRLASAISNSLQSKYVCQCSPHDHVLCIGRHIAGLEQGSILADDAFNTIEAAVRSEYQFDKRAWVVSWRCRFPFSLTRPPEEVF